MTVLGALAVAAPALAVVQPWDPELGRDSDGAVRADRDPVVETAREQLEILRREQTARDRQVATPLLRTLGPQTNGVKTDAIRALDDEWALIPVAVVELSPGRPIRDALCVTNGDGIACTPATALARSGAQTISASKTGTTVAGLVPDGVARVRFVPVEGGPNEVEVRDNFFTLSVPRTAPPRMVRAPEGFDGPQRIPGPPMPVHGTFHWLSADSEIVGPNKQGTG